MGEELRARGRRARKGVLAYSGGVPNTASASLFCARRWGVEEGDSFGRRSGPGAMELNDPFKALR